MKVKVLFLTMNVILVFHLKKILGMEPHRDSTSKNWLDEIRNAAVEEDTGRVISQMLNGILNHKEDPSLLGHYYSLQLRKVVAFMRHLSVHGTDHSFAETDKPRKQMIQSLDETELAGAIILDEYIMEVLTVLLQKSSMTGM
jgi:hypothetical protein